MPAAPRRRGCCVRCVSPAAPASCLRRAGVDDGQAQAGGDEVLDVVSLGPQRPSAVRPTVLGSTQTSPACASKPCSTCLAEGRTCRRVRAVPRARSDPVGPAVGTRRCRPAPAGPELRLRASGPALVALRTRCQVALVTRRPPPVRRAAATLNASNCVVRLAAGDGQQVRAGRRRVRHERDDPIVTPRRHRERKAVERDDAPGRAEVRTMNAEGFGGGVIRRGARPSVAPPNVRLLRLDGRREREDEEKNLDEPPWGTHPASSGGRWCFKSSRRITDEST